MAPNTTFWIVVLSYFTILILSYFSNLPPWQSNLTEQEIANLIANSYPIPNITKRNAVDAIRKRAKHVREDYEKILQVSGWRLLRSSTNVTVELLEPKNITRWPLYIKTTVSIPLPTTEVFKYFQWSMLGLTAKAIDPFLDELYLLFDPSKDIKVFRRTTTKLFILPKRDFVLAMVDSTQPKPFSFEISNKKHTPIRNATNMVKVPKGTLVNTHISVTLGSDYSNLIKPSNEKYIKSYQDYSGWFLDDGYGGTTLVCVMQVDLGPDIPRWVFTHTVGGTGVWAMHALIKMIQKKNV